MSTENEVFFYTNGDTTRGQWVDMDNVTSLDDVRNELYKNGFIVLSDDETLDEWSGEILCADSEGLASAFTGRYGLFDFDGFVECRDDEADDNAKQAYIDCFNEWNSKEFSERYQGEFKNWEDMAYELLEETGELKEIPERLRNYFDYEAYARDIRLGGEMCESNGHFFRNV